MNNIQNSSDDFLIHGPLVSVGIPTYNRPEGLRRTLECITGQIYKNLEIIVSDNCSPGPETEEVVREFIAKDSRIQYYRQDENKGPAFNFKFVLEKATGKYFMWAADDDEWKNTYIEKCLQEFLVNDSLVLCYSEAIKKNYQGQSEVLLSSDITTAGMERLSGIKKLLLNQYRNIEFYGLMKTQIARRYKFENSFGEDQIFILFLALHGEVGKTLPGLFINGPGSMGCSSENTVQSMSIHRMNIYFGYISLIVNSIIMIFDYEFELNIIEKIQIVFFIIRRTFTVRYMRAVGNGIKTLIKDMIKSMKIKSY